MAREETKARTALAFWGAALAVLLADQAAKLLVRGYLPLGSSFPQAWPIRFTHIANTGSAFGLFANQSLFLLFTSVVALAALLLYWRQVGGARPLMRLALGLELGGGVGNLIDRLRFGQVTDFLDVGFWPVFNLADSAIVVGAALIAWAFLLTK